MYIKYLRKFSIILQLYILINIEISVSHKSLHMDKGELLIFQSNLLTSPQFLAMLSFSIAAAKKLGVIFDLPTFLLLCVSLSRISGIMD